ncbi:MAG: BatD family protein [Methanothrix sp.]|nr:BatD family protein [Methanothrix sp.]
MLALTCTAQAVIWDEGISGELHWGETLFLENYTLKLADFSIEESHTSKVLVELQANNLTIASRALQVGEGFTLNDSIKVTVEQIIRGDLQDDPFAKIRLQLPAAADISLILKGNREIYQGGDEMRIQLQIANNGIVDAENLRIRLDSVPPFVNNRYGISVVEAGRVWDRKKNTHEIDNLKINIKSPYFPKPTDLKLRALAQYSDPQGKAYECWGGTDFQISGPIQLHKRVEETQVMQESYYVINSLKNSGNRTLKLDLSDSTGSGFQADSPLSWKLNLSPGESKTISYLIEAKHTGPGQILPNAIVRYSWDKQSYTVRSESPVVDVFGPLIEAERSVHPTKLQPGEVATVSIQLTNTGNKDAGISLLENVPEGTELISGSANESFMLPPNRTYSKDYQLRCIKQGTLRLPPNEISYRDVRGNEYHTSMQALEIDVQAKIEANLTDVAWNETEISDADSETEEKSEKYMSVLLITIVLLLSVAFSRYP